MISYINDGQDGGVIKECEGLMPEKEERQKDWLEQNMVRVLGLLTANLSAKIWLATPSLSPALLSFILQDSTLICSFFLVYIGSFHLNPCFSRWGLTLNLIEMHFRIGMLISGHACYGAICSADWICAAGLNYIFIIVNGPRVPSPRSNAYLISVPVCISRPTKLNVQGKISSHWQ